MDSLQHTSCGRRGIYCRLPACFFSPNGSSRCSLIFMKRFTLLAILLTAVNVFAADTVKKTNAPPKNDMLNFFKMHWDNRVTAFKQENQAWQNVVMLGDSITEGFDVQK